MYHVVHVVVQAAKDSFAFEVLNRQEGRVERYSHFVKN
jgi:hypothetical protein